MRHALFVARVGATFLDCSRFHASALLSEMLSFGPAFDVAGGLRERKSERKTTSSGRTPEQKLRVLWGGGNCHLKQIELAHMFRPRKTLGMLLMLSALEPGEAPQKLTESVGRFCAVTG